MARHHFESRFRDIRAGYPVCGPPPVYEDTSYTYVFLWHLPRKTDYELREALWDTFTRLGQIGHLFVDAETGQAHVGFVRHYDALTALKASPNICGRKVRVAFATSNYVSK